MKLNIVKQSKGKKETVEFKKEIAQLKLNYPLISQIFRIEKLAKKQPTHTKDRSERSGGGRKPWRQKGTGRSRHGSIRSPLWRKGGVTFGPRKENNFRSKVNKKMKRVAILSIIAELVRNDRLILIDQLPKVKKTKEMEKYLLDLPVKEPGTMLIVSDQSDQKRYTKNIPYALLDGRSMINVYNLLNFDYLVISREIFEELVNQK